jgi:hypothetical protein
MQGDNYSYYSRQRESLDQFPELFAVVFGKILDTGRCYLSTVQAGMALKPGIALPGRLAWEEYTENQWRLGIEVGEGKRYAYLPFKKPWYVDLHTRECGPVDSDIPPEVLEEISHLRALTAVEARSISAALADLGLTNRFPLRRLPTPSKWS